MNQLIVSMSEQYPEYDHVLLQGILEWEEARTILADTVSANTALIQGDNLDDTVSPVKGARGLHELNATLTAKQTLIPQCFSLNNPCRISPRQNQSPV